MDGALVPTHDHTVAGRRREGGPQHSRKVRARAQHASARAKNAKTLRDGHLKGGGVHHAPLGVARLHGLTSRRPTKRLWSPGMP
ncbi:hypothetical protein AB9128_01855 [Streptomyces cinereoruber]|uniref:hypothetical protein n=1 Tax=Streptomyces cinereoruber TaxID=67260 RepID=UPI003EBFF66F